MRSKGLDSAPARAASVPSVRARDPSLKRGRPRDAAVDRRILDAARALLAAGGYPALSFDAISQATGVPRSMIYRRWPTKVHVANAVASSGGADFPHVIAAEGLAGQVAAVVDQVLERYRRPEIGAAAVGVIAATQGDRALQQELLAALESGARERLTDIVTEGQGLGLIDPAVSADVLFDSIVGTLIYRVLFSLEPLPPDYAEQLTRQIIGGLRPQL